MSHLIVTIARQYGSGGREIGEEVARLLGCRAYGNELITMAAERGDLHEESLRRVDEVSAGSLLYTLAMGSNMHGIHTPTHLHTPLNDRLFFLQSDIIREIAEREDAVLIGRCADYVLEGYAPLLRAGRCFSFFRLTLRKKRTGRDARACVFGGSVGVQVGQSSACSRR